MKYQYETKVAGMPSKLFPRFQKLLGKLDDAKRAEVLYNLVVKLKEEDK